jgi:hypothetical protein
MLAVDLLGSSVDCMIPIRDEIRYAMTRYVILFKHIADAEILLAKHVEVFI